MGELSAMRFLKSSRESTCCTVWRLSVSSNESRMKGVSHSELKRSSVFFSSRILNACA